MEVENGRLLRIMPYARNRVVELELLRKECVEEPVGQAKWADAFQNHSRRRTNAYNRRVPKAPKRKRQNDMVSRRTKRNNKSLFHDNPSKYMLNHRFLSKRMEMRPNYYGSTEDNDFNRMLLPIKSRFKGPRFIQSVLKGEKSGKFLIHDASYFRMFEVTDAFLSDLALKSNWDSKDINSESFGVVKKVDVPKIGPILAVSTVSSTLIFLHGALSAGSHIIAPGSSSTGTAIFKVYGITLGRIRALIQEIAGEDIAVEVGKKVLVKGQDCIVLSYELKNITIPAYFLVVEGNMERAETCSLALVFVSRLVQQGGILCGITDEEHTSNICSERSFPRDYPETECGRIFWKTRALSEIEILKRKPLGKVGYKLSSIDNVHRLFTPEWSRLLPSAPGCIPKLQQQLVSSTGRKEINFSVIELDIDVSRNLRLELLWVAVTFCKGKRESGFKLRISPCDEIRDPETKALLGYVTSINHGGADIVGTGFVCTSTAAQNVVLVSSEPRLLQREVLLYSAAYACLSELASVRGYSKSIQSVSKPTKALLQIRYR